MKKVLLLSLVAGLLFFNGCEKWAPMDPDIIKEGLFSKLNCPTRSIEGSNQSILGKWKLVEGWSGYWPNTENWTIEDYSCSNVIYHFKEDEILEITSNHEAILSAQHKYEFSLTPSTTYIKHPFFNHNYTIKMRSVELDADFDWNWVPANSISINEKGSRMTIQSKGIQPVSIGYLSFIRIE